jgi:hypothetical protein
MNYSDYIKAGKSCKVSPNFTAGEFSSEPLTEYQFGLISMLAKNIQYIRDGLQKYAAPGKTVSVSISSGVRTQNDYNRICSNGNHPSKTSDHFCGYQTTPKPTLGAADCRFINSTISMKEIYKKIVDIVKSGKACFGQAIYEINPATGFEWIHLGNDPKCIFSAEIAQYVPRAKFLISLDNGKTYIPWNGQF